MLTRYIFRKIKRGFTKSLLLIALSAIMLCSTMWYYDYILLSKEHIDTLYATIPVNGSLVSANGASDNLRIPFKAVELIENTGFIGKSYLEMRKPFIYSNPTVFLSPEKLSSGTMFATNDISRFDMVANKIISITYGDGYDDDIFNESTLFCIINETIMRAHSLKCGDTIGLTGYYYLPEYTDMDAFHGQKYTIAGSYSLLKSDLYYGFSEYDIVVTLNGLVNNFSAFYDNRYSEMLLDSNERYYSQADFVFQNLPNFGEFRDYLKKPEFINAAVQPNDEKLLMFIDDDVLLRSVRPLEQNVALLERLFPVAVAVACLLGGGIPGLIIIQSAKEAAVMRILGTTKRRTRLTLVLEQLSLCTLGLLLGAATLLILHGAALAPVLPKLALCAALYFAACLLATTLCATIVTRGKALNLLQTKE